MTLYALRPDPATGSLDDATVVEESRHGWQFLSQAATLWRLVDRGRAEQIEAIKARAMENANGGEIQFRSAELNELVRLLEGIEDSLEAAGIVDSDWRVSPDQLDALAAQVPSMDLQTERPLHSKLSALGEIISNAISVRSFLANAARANCIVAYG